MRGRNNRNNFNSYNILPSARNLEEYERTAPGSVNKLMEMAKKEQEHRHSWQDRYLKIHSAIYRTGQLFGFTYNLLLLYVVFKLIKSDNIHTALKLFVINALLIALAIIITFTERKITTRKPPRRTKHQSSNDAARSGTQKRANNPNRNDHSERGERGERSGNRDRHHNRSNRGDKDGY